LTFEPPRGCQICHHQAPDSSSCATCHRDADVNAPRPATLSVTVAGHEPRTHDVVFRHDTHRTLRCVQCHTTAVTLAPADDAKRCTSCHDDHHTAARACASCHTGGGGGPTVAWRAPHAPPAEGHIACDACHARATIARLTPDRQLC